MAFLCDQYICLFTIWSQMNNYLFWETFLLPHVHVLFFFLSFFNPSETQVKTSIVICCIGKWRFLSSQDMHCLKVRFNAVSGLPWMVGWASKCKIWTYCYSVQSSCPFSPGLLLVSSAAYYSRFLFLFQSCKHNCTTALWVWMCVWVYFQLLL